VASGLEFGRLWLRVGLGVGPGRWASALGFGVGLLWIAWKVVVGGTSWCREDLVRALSRGFDPERLLGGGRGTRT
jgi:hypothetical protein